MVQISFVLLLACLWMVAPTLMLEVFKSSDGSSIKTELWRETLLDALVLLYPDDIAYQFEEKDEDDEIPF